jgi:hypothetical protein
LTYNIYTTETEHGNHEDASRKGITEEMKNIIDKRIAGNEAFNPEACLQAFRNQNMRVLPTNLQVKNYIAYRKKVLIPNGGNINFLDLERMVEELCDDPKIVDFKYLLNADPSKTQFSIIITCKSLMDGLREQKHGQIDGTFKLITKNFVVILFGYSDVNRHFHCTGTFFYFFSNLGVKFIQKRGD